MTNDSPDPLMGVRRRLISMDSLGGAPETQAIRTGPRKSRGTRRVVPPAFLETSRMEKGWSGGERSTWQREPLISKPGSVRRDEGQEDSPPRPPQAPTDYTHICGLSPSVPLSKAAASPPSPKASPFLSSADAEPEPGKDHLRSCPESLTSDQPSCRATSRTRGRERCWGLR